MQTDNTVALAVFLAIVFAPSLAWVAMYGRVRLAIVAGVVVAIVGCYTSYVVYYAIALDRANEWHTMNAIIGGITIALALCMLPMAVLVGILPTSRLPKYTSPGAGAQSKPR